ncbi:MAG TPA: hypothetical protein VF658_18810 [Pyrinomonadaceae bacterium]
MRRRNLLIVTLLLATLLTGGWGGVIAAAFCVHDAEQPHSSAMAEDHDCCRAKLEQTPEHCSAADSSAPTSHEAMAMDEMVAMPAVAVRAAHVTVAPIQPTGACLHCVSRGGLPTTLVLAREPEQKKREANLAPPPTLKAVAPLAVTFAPSPSARQHAPPGTGARRHLLINVFVI